MTKTGVYATAHGLPEWFDDQGVVVLAESRSCVPWAGGVATS